MSKTIQKVKETPCELVLRVDIIEGPETQFHYALVSLTPAVARLLFQRVQRMIALVQEDPDLDYMIYAPEESAGLLLEGLSLDQFNQLPLLPDGGKHPVRQRGDLAAEHTLAPMSFQYCVCEFGVSCRLSTPHTNFDTSYIPTAVLEQLGKTAPGK